MRTSHSLYYCAWKLALAATLTVGAVVSMGHCSIAQSGTSQNGQPASSSFQGFAAPPQAQTQAEPWKFEGRLHLQKGTGTGYIVLQIDLQPGHYIYSVDPKGSPAPTSVSLVQNAAVKTQGSFSPNVQPLVNENDPVFNRRIEKHKERVQFFIPCEVDPNADFQKAGMPVIEFNGQVCSEGGVCVPLRKQQIPVQFAGYFERENQAASNTPAAQASHSQNPAQIPR